MRFEKAYIPYGGYWSTPFCKWQGSFQNKHALRFAAEMAKRFLDERGISPTEFDELILGTTVPQRSVTASTSMLHCTPGGGEGAACQGSDARAM